MYLFGIVELPLQVLVHPLRHTGYILSCFNLYLLILTHLTGQR